MDLWFYDVLWTTKLLVDLYDFMHLEKCNPPKSTLLQLCGSNSFLTLQALAISGSDSADGAARIGISSQTAESQTPNRFFTSQRTDVLL